MPEIRVYNAGTITVTSGSTAFTGTGTAWDLVGAVGGRITVAGSSIAGWRFDQIDSDTSGAFRFTWPGPSLVDAEYFMELESASPADEIEANAHLVDIARRLRAGFSPLQHQATGSLAARADYDDEVKGFLYLRTDVIPPISYVKLSDTPGDWSEGWSTKGEAGDDGLPGLAASYAGSGAPSAGLGLDGQTYLDLDNGDTYQKVSGAWEKIGSIQGASADLTYAFDSSTGMTDPGAGDLRLNHASFASVTAIAIADVSADPGNPDMSALVTSWGDANNPDKGTLILRKRNAHGSFAIFTVTGLTDNAGWSQIAVAHVASAGSFAGGDDLYVAFVRSGDNGNVLHNGSGAPAGGLGVNGDYYLDTTNLVLYGPKAAGAWGGGSSIVAVEYLYNLDGGHAATLYGGTTPINGGTAAG